jgi:hypothetical protein
LGVVTENGHVFSLTPHWSSLFHKDEIEYRKKSVNEASTFTGFCGYHDNDLFRKLDNEEFSGAKELAALSSYRTVCREIFVKKAHIDSAVAARVVDRGRPLDRQIAIQSSISATLDGANAALSELSELKLDLEKALKSGNFEDFDCRNFHFPGIPEVVSAGAFNPTHTTSGRFLQDLDLETKSQNIFFAILPTQGQGFWVSFFWHQDHTLLKDFVDDFEQHFCTVGGAYAVASAHIENTFYKPSFWESLADDMKRCFEILATMDLLHRSYRRAREAALALSNFRPSPPDLVTSNKNYTHALTKANLENPRIDSAT